MAFSSISSILMIFLTVIFTMVYISISRLFRKWSVYYCAVRTQFSSIFEQFQLSKTYKTEIIKSLINCAKWQANQANPLEA